MQKYEFIFIEIISRDKKHDVSYYGTVSQKTVIESAH